MRIPSLPQAILDRRQHLRRKASVGFGLVELMVTMVVLSVVMLGAFKFFVKSNRTTSGVVKKTVLDRQAVALKEELERALRNMGHNPRLLEYNTDPLVADERIGLTVAASHYFRYQSDDNDRFFPATAAPSTSSEPALTGTIENAESYGYWIVRSTTDVDIDNAGTTYTARQDLSQDGKTLDDSPPCSPIPQDPSSPDPTLFFHQPHILVKLKKDARAYNPSGDSLWSSPNAPTLKDTMPQIVADNVTCFALRYYKFNETAKSWDLIVPPIQNGLGDYDIEADYETLRSIGRIEMGVVLIDMDTVADKADRISGNAHPTIHFSIDIRLPNNAFNPDLFALAYDDQTLYIPGTGVPTSGP